MKPDETVYEWIDFYLNGQLEGETLHDFTKKLKSDKEFSTLVANQKTANDIILGNRLSMVKQMMDADFKSNDTKNNITKWGLGGLLGLSLLACGVLYFSDKNIPVTSYELAHDASKTPSNNIFSNPDKQHAEELNQPSYKKAVIQLIAGTDTTNIKAPLAGTHTNTNLDKETNTFPYLNANDFNQTITDANDVKNQLSDNSINIQKANICLGIIIEGILTIDAACADKNDGEIHIIENSMKGGKAPYTYVLINQNNDTMSNETTSFVSLSTGQYKLFFEDADNCSCAYKKPIYVNEKSCNAQRTQSFSPHSGERFKYPVSIDSDAEITIYNRAGQLVHKTNISKGEPESWDGTNQNGQLLSTGMYIYIIEYVSGTKETGEVVIF